jgi:hypothetical protein
MKKLKSVESLQPKIEKFSQQPLTPFQRAQKELWEKRQKIADKKSAELGKHYTERFNEYLREYFDNFAQTKEENLVSYETLNKSWKKYANEANSSQKYVVLRVNSFEEELARIVKNNVQFHANHPLEVPEEVIDLTNLKSE